MDSINDNHRSEFKFCIFQPTIAAVTLVLAGCASSNIARNCPVVPTLQNVADANPISTAATPPAPPSMTPAPAATKSVVRIKAGSSAPYTDSSGDVWLAEQGFEDGDVIERDGIEIASTKEAGLYQSEHYGMSSISCAFPNGNYIAKLHFAEIFEGITSSLL